MPPKTIAHTYIELLTRGEQIANTTYARKNSRTPLPTADVLFSQYSKWYEDVEKYFEKLGDDATYEFHSYELTHAPAPSDSQVYSLYTLKQLGEEFKKIRKDVNSIKKILRNNCDLVVANTNDPIIKINKSGYTLIFNTVTGEVELNSYKTILPVGQQKYVALKCIVSGPSYKGTYVKLYEDLGLTNKPGKDRLLHDVIRGLKTKLKILPKKSAINPDIFINLSKDGYILK